MNDVARILHSIQQGAARADDELLSLVYDELRRLAARRMVNEAAGQTLQPTALVHVAWQRLGGDQQAAWENRAHFFGAAAGRRKSIWRPWRFPAARMTRG